ncbi:hypothetical protein SD70_10720 [Gordoniibacillus kamchatkensis]|uniref:histidine kinase n=1 Tax=Gordoniibacillus kamchatkensis TaxID=1590651 RepID=A0ABR5AIN1_9BACL|nr:PAS domain-containing sensor histidine kinase [Paenibacillus sp. VKM B-2647]KIL40891.1 hypothetical protein SD70_10720 [Paenibacillus sp. VKM B-2647]
MKFLLKSKLTKRFMTKTIVVILFALASIYFVTIGVLSRSLEQEIVYRDELIAKTLSRQIGTLFGGMKNDTRIASNYVLKYSQEDKQFYYAEMERIVTYNPLYLFVQAFDSQGNPLVTVPDVTFKGQLDIGKLVKRMEWSQTYYISDLLTLPDGRKTIAICYPALSQGQFWGGIVAFVNLDTLSDYLRELRIGDEGITLITDRGGSIIAHNNEQLIGSSLKEHPLSDFLYKERYGVWRGPLFGKDRLVAYRPLQYGGFGLIVGESSMQALAPARNVQILLSQGFIVVLLVSILLVLYNTSSVLKPVFRLTKQAREYKENKRKTFDRISTRDELEDLSNIMGEMARSLTDKERRLFYILESIPYCVITTDHHGRIATFNKGAEQLTQFRRDEVIGKYIIDVPFKENAEEFISWKTLQEGTEFVEVESYIFDKDKNRRDVVLYSSLFRGEDGNVIGAILVIRDVSDMRKLEEYLRQSERLASLGQLTAGVAHEIKNPLSIIQAAAEAIRLELKGGTADVPMLRELTDDILETSDRMNGLLADFLKLSKESAGEEKKKLNLVQILDELATLLRNKMKEQSIVLHREYETRDAGVLVNKNQMSQVFLNMMINSMQAMERGGHLFIRVREQDGHWLAELEDTGKGIAPGKLQRIFNPFFSTKREGTGLGLSIAYEIVTQHGGEISAASPEGKGACLTVKLPKAG